MYESVTVHFFFLIFKLGFLWQLIVVTVTNVPFVTCANKFQRLLGYAPVKDTFIVEMNANPKTYNRIAEKWTLQSSPSILDAIWITPKKWYSKVQKNGLAILNNLIM